VYYYNTFCNKPFLSIVWDGDWVGRGVPVDRDYLGGGRKYNYRLVIERHDVRSLHWYSNGVCFELSRFPTCKFYCTCYSEDSRANSGHDGKDKGCS